MNPLNMLKSVFGAKKMENETKDRIAELLKTSPEALEAFEKAYEKQSIEAGVSDNFFRINAKQMAEMQEGIETDACPDIGKLVNRIVRELVNQTSVYSYSSKDKHSDIRSFRDKYLPGEPVTKDEIAALPETVRPELTGTLMKKDVTEPVYPVLIDLYRKATSKGNFAERKRCYDMFRQGLDIMDLDPITYEMIDMNPISMGYWLPKIQKAVDMEGFFQIPDTKIIKVPMTILQLTRLEYTSHTRTTLDIVDAYCKEVFGLDESKAYFIKTGTYSSKFDFRNAKVTGAKEVRELGEYLLFIHTQALSYAHYDLSGRNQPCIYGMSTTTEWVVRDFIEDQENNPTIYHGLPLHTEYRVFVDFDTDDVIGIHPYWDPEVMKKRFVEDNGDPDMMHDYVTFTASEERLMARYEENKEKVIAHVKQFLPDVHMTGQWSIDIMQNGDEFWLIDMATAERSAYYDCVPVTLRRPVSENWLPDIGKRINCHPPKS